MNNSEYGKLTDHDVNAQIGSMTTADAQRIQVAEHQPPGLRVGLIEGDIVIRIPVSNDQTLAAFFPTDSTPPAVEKGEVLLYSRQAGKVRIQADTTGKVVISNGIENLEQIISDLIDQIKGLQTAGSPANHVVNPTSQVSLDALKIRAQSLLGAP